MLTRATRRAVAAALVGVLGVAPVAAAAPTPPTEIANYLEDPHFVLSLPAGGGAWTVWSGLLAGDLWWAVSSPGAADIAAAGCPVRPKTLTVCVDGTVGPRWSVVLGRVKPRAATVAAFDDAGRRLRSVRRGGAYLVVARGVPKAITVVARNRAGKVVGRQTRVYRRR